MLALLFLLSLVKAVQGRPLYHGFVFGSEHLASPLSNYSSPLAFESLDNLAQTGARSVRILVTRFVDSVNDTAVHGIETGPFASTSPEDLEPFLLHALSLNLSIILSMTVDVNWSLEANVRHHGWYSDGFKGRESIGLGFSERDWGAFFTSWGAALAPFAALAQRHAPPSHTCTLGTPGAVSVLSIADAMNLAYTQESRMRALIAGVRVGYSGCVTAISTGGTLGSIKWWDATDVISHEAFWPLGPTALPIGQVLPVANMTQAWNGVADTLAALSAAHANKPILLLTVGVQSRPNCHLEPWGTGGTSPGPAGNDQGDVSAWPLSYDPPCQANYYASLLQAFTPYESTWYAGFTLWRWSADPSQGGPSDNDWTPHGKVAEGVYRGWAGVEVGDVGVGSVIGALARASASSVPLSPPPPTTTAPVSGFQGWRGWVLGGQDEWSSPNYPISSPGGLTSISNIASVGGNALELVVQWYFASANDTNMYPIAASSGSPMPTSTDSDITTFVQAAKAKGLAVILSPMLDPDWTLASQFNCRTGWPENPGCHWRGEIGYGWGDDCSPGSPWAQWHGNYAAFMLHYATLAQSLGTDAVEALVFAHELMTPTQHCPSLWLSLLSQVRAVYQGKVLAALEGDALPQNSSTPAGSWMQHMDLLGFECYMGNTTTTSSRGGVPWEDTVSVATVRAGQLENLAKLGAWSAGFGGMKIACTEVGWISAPWAAETGWGELLDASDGAIYALDTDQRSMAVAYSAFIQAFEAQPWYAGSFFWFWRADPTAGGNSDSSPVVWGKTETLQAIRGLWLP